MIPTMCNPCTRRFAAYNAARYRNAPKPWPAKTLCAKCKKAIRADWQRWRRTYIAAHPGRVVEQQREYRSRQKAV